MFCDSGSQRMYITECLRDKLNLKPIGREQLHLNTFGDRNFSAHCCDVVHLCLHKPGSNCLIGIFVLCFPVICSSLPSAVDLVDCPHLEGLELANQCKGSRDAIDMLVGLDFYWTIVTGNIKHDSRGPVAISSKLGWLLSGPASVYVTDNTSSHLIYGSHHQPEGNSQLLLTTLKGFWETESIGITDASQLPMEDKEFLEEINFVAGQYEVKLPWREEIADVSDHFDLSLK